MPIPGGWELVAILAVLVLLFGASKLPNAARSIGQSMRIFKAETKGMKSSDDDRKERDSRAQTQQQDPPQALPPSSQPAPAPTEQQQPEQHSDSR